jgi:hypothetical protein
VLSLEDDKTSEAYQFLLGWVSLFGLAENQVEVNRHGDFFSDTGSSLGCSEFSEREEFLQFLKGFSWTPKGNHEALMGDGYLAVLKGLFHASTDTRWEYLLRSSAKREIVQLCFSRIRKELERIELGEFPRFYELTASFEQIHENLSSLLEVISPFYPKDFSEIYQALLEPLPLDLAAKSAVHASGMTSLAGILKAVETSIEARPRIIYGENIYFERLEAIEKVSQAVATSDATEEEWREADLLLVQFNPVWKRGEPRRPNLYREEKIADHVHFALQGRTRPLSVA